MEVIEGSRLIGQSIAGYDVLAELGAGGMGVVYKARHIRLERLVALKLLPPEQVADESRRRRFLQEARAASALNHPGIVTIHDVVTHDGADVIVMELIEGEPLGQRIPPGGLPWREAAEIALALAEAMAAAHAAGIVHRDLKPANVMVTTGGRIKVLDFGIAKLVQDRFKPGRDRPGRGTSPENTRADPALSDLTGLGVHPGTPAYMAPEQLLGEPVDERADIFSLGILLYEMLTGQRPFRGHPSVVLLKEILHHDVRSVRKLRPDVPVALASLVSKALAKQPAKRHQSMDEIGAELWSLLTPDPTAEPGEIAEGVALKALVAVDLVECTVVLEVPGDGRGVEDPGQPPRDLVAKYRGRVAPTEDDCLLIFELPWDAVCFALAFHRTLAQQERKTGTRLETRVGIHLGEVTVGRVARSDGDPGDGDPDAWTFAVEDLAQATAALLLSLAGPRQTLLTHAVFDLARRGAVRQDRDPENRGSGTIVWLAHGDYLFPGEEAVEVFEVGAEGFAPLRPPAATGEVIRAAAQSKILGWRPAPGLTIPRRPDWALERKLGEGGFGEVWLASHAKTRERRVFKFCYEAERLRSLQREITVFRLLKEELGERDDIARVLDWNLDEAPYFIESAYTAGGNLVDWAAARGGIAAVDLGERLELIAQVATALEAAHSVGVLHKDVKPANVLITPGPEGRPRAVLTDFGIGMITDRGRLLARGITALGLTEATAAGDGSTTPGTLLYMAPEVLTGRTPTIQSDVYALGVMLYQVVVGDLERPLAAGWERDVGDELLREDIAGFADGRPRHRPRSALEVADRLRTLDERRRRRRAEEKARLARARGRRRRRLAAWLGGAATVMLLVISVFAYQTLQAKNRELEARQNAEQRRRQAEKLIDFLLGDLRRDLQPIGKLDVLDKVGDQAMAYFAAVPEGDLSNEETRNYAKALHQIGQVRFALGRVPEAAEAFGESLALAESLAARDPTRADWQFELGQSRFWLGFLHWKTGDLAAALEQFEAYRRISEELVARDPENAAWQLELAYSHSNLASVLEKRGELGPAAAALAVSAQVLERLAAGKDDGDPLSVELAHVYAKLGKVLENQGEFTGAQARYEANLDLMRRASAAAPDDIETLRFLGLAHDHVGDVLWLRGDLAGALEHYRADLEIAARIAGRDRENLEWREELALVHNKVARAHLLADDFEQARRHLEEERQIVQALIEESSDPHRWRFAQAIHRLWRSELLVRGGPAGAAIPDLEACRATFEVLARDTEDSRNGPLLARTLWLLGEAHDRSSDAASARWVWREGAELSESLLAGDRAFRHLDLRIRFLLSLGYPEEARPLIEELAVIGYREPSYREFLERHGIAAAAT
jgi:serine/threonine-protein kinase